MFKVILEIIKVRVAANTMSEHLVDPVKLARVNEQASRWEAEIKAATDAESSGHQDTVVET